MRLVHLVVCVFLGLPVTVLAASYVVDPHGTGDYPTIQTAINSVVDGDIVELTDGIFTGEGNRDIDFLGKAITVRSQNGDPRTCIIDCDATGTDPHRGFYFRSGEPSAAVLEGVTITGGLASPPYEGGGGIACLEGTSPTITRCILSDNAALCGGGMDCNHASPTITECVFSDNSATHKGGAFGCRGPSAPTLRGCTFSHNSAPGGGGVYC
jgi:predicted outer membrane repeat protein